MNEKVLYFKSWLTSKLVNLGWKKNSKIETILIIKLDEIGDLVTALPVFYNLNHFFPNATQTLICKSFNTTFFTHLKYVKCVTNLDEVKSKKFDLIIDLRGNEETRKYSLRSKPKLRLDRGSVRLFNKFNGGQKNEIDTNLQILEPLLGKKLNPKNDIKISEKEKTKISEYLDLNNAKPFVIAHLGARDIARRWPIERFAEIIDTINSNYGMACILVGGKEDYELNESCLNKVTSKHNYTAVGEFDLLEFAALCERASLFIGNESGPLHIAAAMNTPNIALFGPGVKGVFYPKNAKSIVHHYFLARNHTSQTIENSTIFSITVDEVKASVQKMLD